MGLYPQKAILILCQPHPANESPSFQNSHAKGRAHSRSTAVSIWSRPPEQVSDPAHLDPGVALTSLSGSPLGSAAPTLLHLARGPKSC